MKLPSKLPEQQESIFVTMSRLAQQYDAINLSQGFPDFGPDDSLLQAASNAFLHGNNQYGPLAGIPALRERIAVKVEGLHGAGYDPDSEITITNGATQALFNAITALVHQGDEVILIDPAYDMYAPAIRLQGGTPLHIPLKGEQRELDLHAITAAITSKTRMLVLNNPQNPTGRVFSHRELKGLQDLLEETPVLLLSDEVYEHLVFDDEEHRSVCRYAGLRSRAVICSSFGKTFHTTGWKMGYCLAPAALSAEVRKVHEYNVFCVNHPLQHALATHLAHPRNYLKLRYEMQAKRDRFLDGIAGSRFTYQPAQGSYFQLLGYGAISDLPDTDFARLLVKEHGIAAIPVSVFSQNGEDRRELRFCFAKEDATLDRATAILREL